jgi:ubiquinone/menaquinone biosynthesis C-methylase UbiE
MSDNSKPAREVVQSFYDKFGWQTDGDKSGEDKLFRTFPRGYDAYQPFADKRVLKLLEGKTGSILFVGAGDMPANHVKLSEQFDTVACMDISKLALELSEKKLGRGNYYLDSIVSTNLESAYFDVVYCAHVVYHIDKMEQETAVRQMIRLTKPGGRIIIIYANPHSPFAIPGEIARWLKRGRVGDNPELYYSAYPFSWWNRFRPRMMPWQIIGSRPARTLIRGSGTWFFKTAGWFEERFPKCAVKFWQYPIVIIDKADVS